MILEIAIGDAYGAGFEYDSLAVQKHNDLSAYLSHNLHKLRPGAYTDDTQMTLAIAEAMLEDDEWSALNLAQRFCDVFHRDPRKGYAGAFYKFLVEHRDGESFLKDMRPVSDKSGGAMRVCPVGFYSDPHEVMTKAETQAAITHNTPDGIAAAKAAALATHFFVYNLGEREFVGEFVNQYEKTRNWDEDWEGKVKAQGWMSVRAAITVAKRCDNFADILLQSVAFTGDVDTVAAIAAGIVSESNHHESNIPEHLYYGLECGTYGREYLESLDERLRAKFTQGEQWELDH